MANQDQYESIDAYLNGSLSETERASFEAQLQSDPDLAAQILLFKDIDTAIGDKAALNFQQMLQEEGDIFLEKKTSSEGETPVRKMRLSRSYMGIAAALLVLVVGSFLFWKFNSSNALSGPELYAQHFERYDLNQSRRGDATGADGAFLNGIQQYQGEDFDAATKIFEGLAASAEQDMVLAFCLAQAYLSQQEPAFDLAAVQLRKIIDHGASIYVPNAKWYLSLILLEQEQIEAAVPLLKDLQQSPDQLGKQATAVLKDLKR